MTRIHLVLLFGVAALLTVGDVFSWPAWRRGPWTRWLPLAGAAVVTLAIAHATRDADPRGDNMAGAAAHFAAFWSVPSNIFAFPIHLVLTSAFALAWTALRWRALLRRKWMLILGCIVGAVLLDQTWAVGVRWALVPLFGLAFATLVDVLVDAYQRRDALQATLGAWLLLPLPTAIYVQLPPKILLGSAPAVAILLARAMSGLPVPGRRAFALATVAGAALGVLILNADAAMGEVNRAGARALVAPQVAAGRAVWYVGHWGFQWYAEKAGARCWSTEPPYPVEGDLIASTWNSSYPLVNDLEVLTHLGRVEERRPGLRIMSREDGAGFYSNHWGYLPVTWGDGQVEAVDLWLAVRSDVSAAGAPVTSGGR